jgi:hypothetical protein
MILLEFVDSQESGLDFCCSLLLCHEMEKIRPDYKKRL